MAAVAAAAASARRIRADDDNLQRRLSLAHFLLEARRPPSKLSGAAANARNGNCSTSAADERERALALNEIKTRVYRQIRQ